MEIVGEIFISLINSGSRSCAMLPLDDIVLGMNVVECKFSSQKLHH